VSRFCLAVKPRSASPSQSFNLPHLSGKRFYISVDLNSSCGVICATGSNLTRSQVRQKGIRGRSGTISYNSLHPSRPTSLPLTCLLSGIISGSLHSVYIMCSHTGTSPTTCGRSYSRVNGYSKCLQLAFSFFHFKNSKISTNQRRSVEFFQTLEILIITVSKIILHNSDLRNTGHLLSFPESVNAGCTALNILLF
jgi:hypothetical protein